MKFKSTCLTPFDVWFFIYLFSELLSCLSYWHMHTTMPWCMPQKKKLNWICHTWRHNSSYTSRVGSMITIHLNFVWILSPHMNPRLAVLWTKVFGSLFFSLNLHSTENSSLLLFSFVRDKKNNLLCPFKIYLCCERRNTQKSATYLVRWKKKNSTYIQTIPCTSSAIATTINS